MSVNTRFQLKYDGPIFASHEMDVRDLAPALLSIGEILEEANSILNNDSVKITVNVKANSPGSVLIDFSTAQSILTQAQALFNSDGINAFLNVTDILKLLGFVTGSAGGVVGIILWMRGRQIKNVIKVDVNNFKIELDDGEVRIVKKTEIDLFSALKIRKSLETIIRTPLKKPGAEKVIFIDAEDNSEEILKDQSDFFEAPSVSEEEVDQIEFKQSLQIVNISFQDGGKWRFSDGNTTFYAEILDLVFLEKVQQNQAAFAKDDILSVLLRKRQAIIANGIRTDYTVVKVLDHRSAAITIKLPFSE